MITKLLFASTVISATLFVPISYACDAENQNLFEIEKASLSALINNTPNTLYNFRTRQCVTFIKEHNITSDTSVFLPGDETSLGIYQFYLDQGENRIDALKNTLTFIISEQQS